MILTLQLTSKEALVSGTWGMGGVGALHAAVTKAQPAPEPGPHLFDAMDPHGG